MTAQKIILGLLLIVWLAAGPASSAQTSAPASPGCNDLLATRLILNERGRVTRTDPAPVNLRAEPGTNADLLGQIPAGVVFFVLEGPACTARYTWYRVTTRLEGEPLEGWVAEGDARAYFLERYPPGL